MAAHSYGLGQARIEGGGFLARIVRPHHSLLVSLIVFSAVVNVMALAVSLFSMQIFDRVLTSQSRDTLLFLTLAVTLSVALSALLEGVRQMAAGAFGRWLSARLGPALLAKSLEQRLTAPGRGLEALRSLSTVSAFLGTPTLFAVVDMLWVPVYLAVVTLLHPVLGAIAAVGAGILLGLAWLNERGTRARLRSSQSMSTANLAYAESLLRNGEAIDAMGMSTATVNHWAARFARELDEGERPRRFSVTITALARFFRYMVQVLLLGEGALLVLDRDLTGGAMIAGSIIVGRLMAPIESSIGYWKQFVLASQALVRIGEFCALPPSRPSTMRLPRPEGDVQVSGVTYLPPRLSTPVLRNVSFSIHAGEMLALVGPSASGKTTLSRLLIGTIPPSQGHVRLDGADVSAWMREDLGPHIGYLPQDVELLPGTVRQNIARFSPDASDADVVAAARLADCHEMILQLDGGYEMELIEGGLQLSGGQRQRIGLARALVGQPRLVVLDEPNASLDQLGETALFAALNKLKKQGVTTVVVSHRTNLLRLADKVVVLEAGRMTGFGTAREIIGRLADRAARPRGESADAAKPSSAGAGLRAVSEPEEQRA